MGQKTDKDYLYKGDTSVAVLKTIQKNRADYDGPLEYDLDNFVPYLTSNIDTFESFKYLVNEMGANIMYQPNYKKSALVNIVEASGKYSIKYFGAIKDVMVANQNKVIEYLGDRLGQTQSQWLFSDTFAEWLYEQPELLPLYEYIFNSTGDTRFMTPLSQEIFIF